MPWFFLILAGLLEVVWATLLKQSAGFTRLAPSVLTLIALLGSLGLLALAMRSIPMSVAYPTWTGIGAVGAVVAGAVFFGETMNVQKIGAALLIIAGLVLLKRA